MAITSGGRTVLELAALQVPTMVICQNPRELTHEFAREENGVVNLGLCTDLDFDRFQNEFELLVRSNERRNEMRERAARLDLRQGKKRVIDVIVSTAMGEDLKWEA
jgi:UDP-N-acetylglucosamine:LPS N-acetylglucosamine transferase